jgi:hypothetical protein
MKKIIISAILMIALISTNQAAVKVNFVFTNLRLVNGYLTMDIRATVLAAQVWRVGSCNFRLDWVTIPAGRLVDSVEAHTYNANPNIEYYNSIGNPNYGTMTTTSISGGTAISMNVVKLGGACYRFNPGTYTIGSFRFRRLDTTAATCGRFTIRTTSVVYDSLTLWANVTDWTATVDTTCYRFDIVGLGTTAKIPSVFKLYTNYPNPFNPSTTIQYDVPRNTNASLIVYDLLGKEVTKLMNGYVQPGSYEVVWDAANYASGTYFYRFETDYFTDVKKMTLIK